MNRPNETRDALVNLLCRVHPASPRSGRRTVLQGAGADDRLLNPLNPLNPLNYLNPLNLFNP